MSKLNLVQLVVATLVVVLSIVILGVDIKLIDENRLWHHNVIFPMIWWSEREGSEGRYFMEWPEHYSFARPGAFIAFYIVIVAANVMHLLLLAKARKEGYTQTPRWSKCLLLTIALSFILAFVAVVYGWQGAGTKFTTEQVRDQTHEDYNSPTRIEARVPNSQDPLATLDPFTWNCAFVPLLEIGVRQQPAHFKRSHSSFKSMCDQTKAIIGLTIPVLFLCTAMLGTQMWILIRGRKTVNRVQPNFIKMPDDPPTNNDGVTLTATPGQTFKRGPPGYPEGYPEVIPERRGR